MSITKLVCLRCGTGPPEGDRYCRNCGLDLGAQFELPSLQEWRDRQQRPSQGPHDPAARGNGLSVSGMEPSDPATVTGPRGDDE